MIKNNISRKFHLGNIEEWLALTETPLRKAQEATAKALKAHWETSNTEAMASMTDIANTVNTALVWVMCAQDMICEHLSEGNLSPENVVPSDAKPEHWLECSHCGAIFSLPGDLDAGDTCPACQEGIIDCPIPF